MRKFVVLLCALLLTVQYVAAQHSLYVITNDHKLEEYPSITKVSFDDNQLVFEYGEVTEVTKSSFSASVNVSFLSDAVKTINQTIEVGICFSYISATPTIQNGKLLLGSSLDKYSFSINGINSGTTYYYRAYVKVGEAILYGDVCQETTLGKKSTNVIINGHKFVNLGLPSGLLWAETNIGAETAADEGDFFAWGETETKSTFTWDTYMYGTSSDNLTKYNNTDKKTTLDKEDDVAYVNWGSSCRTPTQTEFEELCNTDNCTWTWTSRTNSSNEAINGYEVTSKKNGNSIFLPASGLLGSQGLIYHGSEGNYWSSTLYNYDRAYYRYFRKSLSFIGSISREDGLNVRPVAEQ